MSMEKSLQFWRSCVNARKLISKTLRRKSLAETAELHAAIEAEALAEYRVWLKDVKIAAASTMKALKDKKAPMKTVKMSMKVKTAGRVATMKLRRIVVWQ